MATAVRNRDAARAKRTRVVEMRLAGHTLDAIAEANELASASGVRYHLDAWLAEQRPSSEQTEELRQVQAAQIDALTEKLQPWLLEAELALPATDRLIKLMDRKARLMGLDLQQGVTVNVITSEAISELLWPVDAVVEGEAIELEPGGADA